jgi:hypothetical protein
VDEPREYPVPVASDEEVAAFIARYGTPYDPETDDYHRDPFVADIREGKNDPIYNAHSYHTKVPPRAIIPYILHYTEPGDIILDPFCGSGMTGVAALMCSKPPKDQLDLVPGSRKGARAAILNDLSPGACHIAHNYCNPIDPKEFWKAFEEIGTEAADEFSWLYETVHFEPAVGVYDPKNPEVNRRLRNAPPSEMVMFEPGTETDRDWELLERSEVERRLGSWCLEHSPLPEGADTFIGMPATIQHALWSDVYKCEGMIKSLDSTGRINARTGKPTFKSVRRPRGCGGEIVLWDSAVDRGAGEVSAAFPCPNCGQQWKKTQIKRTSVIPVVTFYRYRGLRASRGNGSKPPAVVSIRTNRRTTDFERRRLHEIEAQMTPWPYPNEEINTKGPQYNRNALSARGVRLLAHFYTPRNLWALSSIWTRASRFEPSLRNHLLFTATAMFGRIERMTNYKFGKGGNCCLKGQPYFPSLAVEDNVFREFESKAKHIADFLKSASFFRAETAKSLVRCHDAERFLEGRLSPHPTDAEILGWIEKLYSAAGRLEEEALGLVEPGEEPVLPADLIAYYRMMPRLLQSVLKENVDASAYTRASRQCRTAARKIQEHDDRKEAKAQSRSGPRQGKLFD